jgi:hypothetical protein
MDKLLVFEKVSAVLLILNLGTGENTAFRVGWYIFICSLA